MSGLSIEKIKEDRQRGYEYFKSLGVTDKEIEVIDNLQEDTEGYIATDYLSTDIKLLGEQMEYYSLEIGRMLEVVR